MPFLWEQSAAQTHGIHKIVYERLVEFVDAGVVDEVYIKIYVVTDYKAVTHKVQKSRKYIRNSGRGCEHFIGNARELCNEVIYFVARIDKLSELIGYSTVYYAHRTEFYNIVPLRIKAGGFKVYDRVCSREVKKAFPFIGSFNSFGLAAEANTSKTNCYYSSTHGYHLSSRRAPFHEPAPYVVPGQ